MRKKSLLFSFLMIFVISSYGQSTISGNVRDLSGEPIIGASVVIDGTVIGSATDINGNYTITDVSDGNYTITAQFIGYSSSTKNVSVSGNTTLNFTLNQDAIGLDNVIVTATYTTRTQKESPLSLTSFNANQLNQLSANSQADILRNVPGVTAEGGGGEVAANVFVRGLPSGGQYVFNPLQFDGMPVMSTFGLNSSAHDVYVRNDIGIRNLEFVRGGVSSLFGAGSVAGIINYSSKTGDRNPGNMLQMEWADKGRYKADFYSGGQLGGENSNTYYALTGFYRYDDGPVKSGLPTEGFQLRGNLKKVFEKGSFTLHGQYIDDKVQFFLPLVLDGSSRERVNGDNGNKIKTFQTEYANLSYLTPNGTYESPIGDGVVTQGGYLMGELKHNFSDDWKLSAKLRYAKYDHQFNLFLPSKPQSINDYATSILKGIDENTVLNTNSLAATYVSTTTPIPGNNVFIDRALDRNRPMRDLAAEFNVTKIVEGVNATHNITLGVFASRTTADDFNVVTQYMAEFNNIPRLVDLSVQDTNGKTYVLSKNGITNRGMGYTNKDLSANKLAGYLMDEIVLERWRFDIGMRVETTKAKITSEGSKSYLIDTETTLVPTLQNVNWGNGTFAKGEGSTTDWALVLAGLYKLNTDLSLYANASKGYFFPQPRGIKVSNGVSSSYDTEKIYQGEVGAKYGTAKLSGTAAIYYVKLEDRRDVKLVNNSSGGVDEVVTKQDTKSIGFESTFDWRFYENFSLNGNLTYQHHKYTKYEGTPANVDNWLERQPRWLWKLGADYDNGIFDAGVSWNYMGKKYPNAANTVSLDPIHIVRADVGYTFKFDDIESLRIGASVFNLLDDEGLTEGDPRDITQSGGGEYFIGRPILPRRFFVRATFNF